MQRSGTTVHGRALALLIAAACAAALASAFACGATENVHETEEARSGKCVSCHASAYRVASNPVHTNRMPDTCEQCHTTKAWSPVNVKDHVWWPLQNKHVGVACASCHASGFRAGDTPKDCAGCHEKDYDGAASPKHVGFPLDCAMCHTDAGFRPSSFKHLTPLDGKHATAPCAGCHTGDPPRYQGTPTDCQSCHQKDYDGAKNPIHQGFPTTCASCHTPVGWGSTSYVHVWPLQGRHALVPCNSCHTGSPPKYKGTATDCFTCHQAAYGASTFANHGTFPHTCLDCHTMAGWKKGAITGLHPEASFPRTTGAHADARIKCQDCHVLARGTSAGGQNTDCVHCHVGSHVTPAIDARHAQLNVASYPVAPTTTNFCLGCHPAGKK